MKGFTDTSVLDTIKYPYQICGIFKTPVRAMSDDVTYKDTGND